LGISVIASLFKNIQNSHMNILLQANCYKPPGDFSSNIPAPPADCRSASPSQPLPGMSYQVCDAGYQRQPSHTAVSTTHSHI